MTNNWVAMIKRCTYPKHNSWPNYGGRGIVVCDRWLNSFSAFYSDMGPKPGNEYTLDRIDNNGPYSPENCRWATYRTQARNRRNTVILSCGGLIATLPQWAEMSGINHATLRSRLRKGWSHEDTILKPVEVRKAVATEPRPRKEPLGASWIASKQKWRATVWNKGRNVSLGYYKTRDEAHATYLTARSKLTAARKVAATLCYGNLPGE